MAEEGEETTLVPSQASFLIADQKDVYYVDQMKDHIKAFIDSFLGLKRLSYLLGEIHFFFFRRKPGAID